MGLPSAEDMRMAARGRRELLVRLIEGEDDPEKLALYRRVLTNLDKLVSYLPDKFRDELH
jgi:hypothetical protein